MSPFLHDFVQLNIHQKCITENKTWFQKLIKKFLILVWLSPKIKRWNKIISIFILIWVIRSHRQRSDKKKISILTWSLFRILYRSIYFKFIDFFLFPKKILESHLFRYNIYYLLINLQNLDLQSDKNSLINKFYLTYNYNYT